MAKTSENVRVATTGAIYWGPTTATAPTASDSTLTAFTELGYANSDGISFTTSRDTSDITAWQNAALVRKIITGSSVTYSFTLLETNAEVIEAFYGSAMVDGKVAFNPGKTGGRKSFVIDAIDVDDAGDKIIRHYIPSGEIIEIGEQTFTSGDAIQYNITITAYEKDGRVVDILHSEFEPLV